MEKSPPATLFADGSRKFSNHHTLPKPISLVCAVDNEQGKPHFDLFQTIGKIATCDNVIRWEPNIFKPSHTAKTDLIGMRGR
jgi:hypothetical protein